MSEQNDQFKEDFKYITLYYNKPGFYMVSRNHNIQHCFYLESTYSVVCVPMFKIDVLRNNICYFLKLWLTLPMSDSTRLLSA
jgi:hypothetical protein